MATEMDGTLAEEAREWFVAPLLYWLLIQARPVGSTGSGSDLPPPESRHSLPASPPDLPGSLLEALAEPYYANAARKCALLRMLEALCDLFTERRIPFLLLKGAALEAALGLPPALRVMADLDLLVAPDRLLEAERLLIERGLVSTRDTLNTGLLRRRGYHLAPYTASCGAAVELHREALPRSAPFHLPAAALWQDSRAVTWRGREVRVPSAEHLFLHTCIHYRYWHTRGVALRRLWDLGLIGTRMELDRSALERSAARAGALRLMHAGLEELEALDRERAAGWPELTARLCAGDELASGRTASERTVARLQMLDHCGQRWRMLLHALLPTWEETANATGCPTRAHHLGHFLHPRRLGRGIVALLRP